jgi:aminotransferase in exopolysaccharide biosynthesis
VTSTIFDRIIKFIKEIYPEENPVPLHRPVFEGNEKKYLVECIDSGYVSSVGPLVKRLEELVCEFTGSPYSVATTNGTAALHISLLLSNVKPGDLVITQPLTFVAATNSIRYAGADPVFIDIDPVTLGLSHESLAEYIKHQTTPGKDGFLHERSTGKRISACLPVDTFGHPVKIDNLVDLCEAHHISLIEDATEAIGSFYKNHHAGTFGRIGVLSFNGNKTITTGGGGMILTKDKNIAEQARYLTTQAKKDHPWEYIHDDIGYNYRMPNINAALGCAQMEQLPGIIIRKRAIASRYQSFFQGSDIQFIMEPPDSLSNYWLNAILLKDKIERNRFLKFSHENGVLSRPAWRLINRLKMYNKSRVTNIHNAEWIADRLVNLPSSI